MTRPCLTGSLALVSLAAVAGCTEAETPADCVARFTKVLAGGPDLGAARFRPIFTYDVTEMDDALETLVGKGDELKGLRMTFAHGPSEAALRAFYEAEVPRKGAVFAADDFSLFRSHGAPGTREETLAAGCRAAPPKARLVHVQWNTLSQGTPNLPDAPGAGV